MEIAIPCCKSDSPLRETVEITGNSLRALLALPDAGMRGLLAAVLESEEYAVFHAASAAETVAILRRFPCDVLLCEVGLPDRDGFDLLRETLATCPDMPVILMAGQATVEMARQALVAGACDFLPLPCSPADLPIIVERNLTRHALQKRQALRQRMAIQISNESMLDALLTALDTRDTEPQGHSERVTAYTMELADRYGLHGGELHTVEQGALLHDIGNISIPDRILLKSGKLTPEEWEEMRKHPVIGYEMCCRIEMLQQAALVIRHHHEAWDGSGYPDGMRGKQIPLGARLFALADALDAITSDRPYRPAQPFATARAEIVRCAATQFDPDLVTLFLSIPEARWEYIRSLTDR